MRTTDYSLQEIARLGQWLAAAESESKDPNALGAAAALRLVLARELGLPLTAAAELSMIKGKLSLGATLLRARAIEYGYRVKRIDELSNDETCTAAIESIETGDEIGRSTFTIEQAQRRNLVKDRGSWVTMPERMLWARATTEVLRDYAPEVIVGLAVNEELDEYGVEPIVDESDDEPEPDEPPPDSHTLAQDEHEYAQQQAEQPIEKMSDGQRRKLFAIVGDLDKKFPPPLRHDGTQAGDWRTIMVDLADLHFQRDVHELSKQQASDLIGIMQARLTHEEREWYEREVEPEQAAESAADADAPADADDIPF